MTVYFYQVNGICIDTGLAHLQKDVLEIVKSALIEVVLLTHYHEDHSGNAAKIQDELKIPIYGSKLTKEILKKGFHILPYQHLVWGRSKRVDISTIPRAIEIKNLCLKAIHTPGHSDDHTVYLEENRGWLFSGDLYISDRIRYFRYDEDFYSQILSLKKILRYDFETIFCSHRPQLNSGKKRVAKKLQYFEDLYGNVKKLWENGNSAKEIKTELKLKEDDFVRLFTFGTVSLMNMIKSIIRSIKEHEKSN